MSAKNDKKRLQDENDRMKAEIKRIKTEIKNNKAKMVELSLKVKSITIYNHSQLQRFFSILPSHLPVPVIDEDASLNEFFYTMLHNKMVGYIHLVENFYQDDDMSDDELGGFPWDVEIRQHYGSDHSFILMISEFLNSIDGRRVHIFIQYPKMLLSDTLFKRLEDELGFTYSSSHDNLYFNK